jgi:hypothetical protein
MKAKQNPWVAARQHDHSAMNSIVAPAAEPILSRARRRLAPLSLLLGSNFYSAPV